MANEDIVTDLESTFKGFAHDNKEFNNEAIWNFDHLKGLKYVASLDSKEVGEFIRSHGLLYGRYLDCDGTTSMATHAIYEFPENIDDFDKFQSMFDHPRKEIQTKTHTKTLETQLMKSGINTVDLQAKVQIAAFGCDGGIKGQYMDNATSESKIDKNRSNLKIITRRDLVCALVKTSDECLNYTRGFMNDLNEILLYTAAAPGRDCKEEKEDNKKDSNDETSVSRAKERDCTVSTEKDEKRHHAITNVKKDLYNEWDAFFRKYGHFTISVAKVGGALFIDTDIETNDQKSIQDIKNETRKYFSINANVNKVVCKASGDASYDKHNKNINSNKRVEYNKNIDCTLQCMGGNPYLASVNSIDAWEESLVKNFRNWDVIQIDSIQSWEYHLKYAMANNKDFIDQIEMEINEIDLQCQELEIEKKELNDIIEKENRKLTRNEKAMKKYDNRESFTLKKQKSKLNSSLETAQKQLTNTMYFHEYKNLIKQLLSQRDLSK